jgi:hypothetical protein
MDWGISSQVSRRLEGGLIGTDRSLNEDKLNELQGGSRFNPCQLHTILALQVRGAVYPNFLQLSTYG